MKNFYSKKEKIGNNNINIINNNIILNNNIINNDNNIFSQNINGQNFINQNFLFNSSENKSNQSIINQKSSKNDILLNENKKNIDENLIINDEIDKNQELKNIKIDNIQKNKGLNILQNLKGITNSNIPYGSTLLSNISYSSFLSFKNKKIKFCNLNSSNNQSLLDKKKKQESQNEQEKIDEKEIIKNILEKLGGNTNEDVINEIDKEKIENIKLKKDKDIIEEDFEEENLHFMDKSKDGKKLNNESLLNDLQNQKNKIKVNSIKCTLSLLDNGKAIFVSDNDDIFYLPSILIDKNMQVGNSYLLEIDKVNDIMKKYNEIDKIQNKYKEWK